MATPSAVTAQYSNALISTFDIHKPEKRDILYRKYGDQGMEFFKMIDKLGFSTPVAQQDYQHFEEDWIWVPVHSRNAVASPGVGNSINFTLASYDLDSGNRFFIALNDNVMFANQVTGTVTAVNVTVPTAPVITVRPNDTTNNIGALAADDTIIIYSNDWAEGTGQPDGKVARVIEYSFNTKIVKETNAYTGSEATNQTWTTVTSDGQSIPALYLKGQLDTDYRMALRMNGALLFDQTTTDATLLAAGNRTTQGLIPWVRGGGNVAGYNVGFYSMADFDIQNRILDQNFAPKEEVAMLGFDLQTEWENLFTNSFVNGAIVYGMYGEGKKAIDLSIGFNSFNKNERQWHIKRMTGFNMIQTFGAPGYKIPGMGVVMPIDGRKDPQTGNLLPSVGQRYKALGNYNRKMKVWLTGGAIAVTNQTDADALNIRSEFGSEFVASNRFFLIEES